MQNGRPSEGQRELFQFFRITNLHSLLRVKDSFLPSFLWNLVDSFHRLLIFPDAIDPLTTFHSRIFLRGSFSPSCTHDSMIYISSFLMIRHISGSNQVWQPTTAGWSTSRRFKSSATRLRITYTHSGVRISIGTRDRTASSTTDTRTKRFTSLRTY